MTVRAMLCGINYYKTENELQGCINDILDMKNLLLNNGVEEKNITILSDAPNRRDINPTRANILKYLKEVASSARSGDTLVFHYSGHGTYSRDTNKDEADKRDEAICPVDDMNITDDELYGMLRQLPANVKAFVLMDCCHSASILDLKNGLDKEESKREDNSQHGYVVEISGCQDNQTSADALFKDSMDKSINKREVIEQVKTRGVTTSRYRGALTAAFMSVAAKKRGLEAIFDICFSGSKTLMLGLRKEILDILKKNKFTQKPNIAFEGIMPTPLVESREPILHGFRAGRYNLRQTTARVEAEREYVESVELQKHGVKLR